MAVLVPRRRQICCLTSIWLIALILGSICAAAATPKRVHADKSHQVQPQRHRIPRLRGEVERPFAFFAANATAGHIPQIWKDRHDESDLIASQVNGTRWAEDRTDGHEVCLSVPVKPL
eukprot:2564342-Amphidinium_carterae.1